MAKSKSCTKIKSLKELREIARTTFFGEQFVNSDLEPTCSQSMRVVDHIKLGKVHFSELELFFLKEQIANSIKGGIFRRKLLKTKKVINACVLDRLMVNPNTIPESWKESKDGRLQIISFFGTIYSNKNCDLYVRTMYFSKESKNWHFSETFLGDYWEINNPVVVLSE